MATDPIVDELVKKTYEELAQANKPKERSRMSQTANGYVHLIAWSNASLLRILIKKFTSTLPSIERRLKMQLDDAARSVIANIEEGYRRPTTIEYLTFLGYSQASLVEVKGDIQRCRQDNILKSIPNSNLLSLGILLNDWHTALKQSVVSDTKGIYGNLKEHNPLSPLSSYKFLYNPVDNLKIQSLTFEIFLELINKTDWNLRKLVSSLEEKMTREQKYYQIEKARIRGNINWRK